jgi:hypothetical protein
MFSSTNDPFIHSLTPRQLFPVSAETSANLACFIENGQQSQIEQKNYNDVIREIENKHVALKSNLRSFVPFLRREWENEKVLYEFLKSRQSSHATNCDFLSLFAPASFPLLEKRLSRLQSLIESISAFLEEIQKQSKLLPKLTKEIAKNEKTMKKILSKITKKSEKIKSNFFGCSKSERLKKRIEAIFLESKIDCLNQLQKTNCCLKQQIGNFLHDLDRNCRKIKNLIYEKSENLRNEADIIESMKTQDLPLTKPFIVVCERLFKNIFAENGVPLESLNAKYYNGQNASFVSPFSIKLFSMANEEAADKNDELPAF